MCSSDLFHVLIGHLYVFFGEMSVSVFCSFLDWVVCFFDTELHELLVKTLFVSFNHLTIGFE